jgi:hypothetical protein
MKSSRSRAGGRRQYWAQAARRLHMCDTPYGVRFTRDPNCETLPEEDQGDRKKPSKSRLADSCRSLVSANDKELVTDYLFLIMDQMKVCEFSEEDRAGGRSKVKDIPVGFPGMECKHCSGRAGWGRYFPLSLHTLTLANSDRNIYNHIMKCRKCPQETKAKLEHYQSSIHGGSGSSKIRRGSRKEFFTRIWNRMHETQQERKQIVK